MPATLSRYTLAYFGAALLSLLIALGLVACGIGLPFEPGAGDSLAVLHLVVIGWLSLLMVGALLQFVPVLVSRPLVAPGLALPALLLLVSGLLALVLCFFSLSGRLDLPQGLFQAAGLLLASGFLLVIVMIGGTIAMARPIPPQAQFVAAGLMSLLLAAGLGTVFAETLGGFFTRPLALDLLGTAPSFHALAGLFGWLGLTAMGVSYRLLAMFLLSADKTGTIARLAMACGTACLVLLCLATFLAATGADDGNAVFLAALLAALLSAALYLVDVLSLYGGRKRRFLDLSARASASSFTALGLAMLVFLVAFVDDNANDLLQSALFIFVFGWLSGLGLAKLYKIVAFLTWLECYGPVLGRTETPRVQDLVRDNGATIWFTLYFGAVGLAASALAVNWMPMVRVGAALALVATLGLVREYVRARRLAYVPLSLRFPQGTFLPRLWHSSRAISH